MGFETYEKQHDDAHSTHYKTVPMGFETGVTVLYRMRWLIIRQSLWDLKQLTNQDKIIIWWLL